MEIGFFERLESPSIAALGGALAKAQAEIGNAKKDADNPFFKSKYADLAAVRDCCQAPLSKNGLAVTQKPTFISGSMFLITDLIHSSGEWTRSILPVKPTKDDPQGMGSAMTYARRYALSAIVGVATEDDDGNAASTPQKAQEVYEPEPKYSREHKIQQVELIDMIAACTDALELQDFLEMYQGMIDGLPENMQGAVNQQYNARQDQLEKNINPARTYRFVDVEHAKAWGATAAATINQMTGEKLDEWKSANTHKLKAIDEALKAKTYQKEGKTPGQRINAAWEAQRNKENA